MDNDLLNKTPDNSADAAAKTADGGIPFPGQPQQQFQPQQQQFPQQTAGVPPVTHQYYQYTPVNPALVSQQNTADGFAIASLICSLVGLVCCCTLVPSLLAVIFGAVSKAKNDGTRPTGMSTAGLILGIIGMILNVIILFAMFYGD
ncbi:MAG: DUF4190 domain-containing protein [Clostridia bacterium]|nr:DUF4190 domain-containing protein [Clostridia bacterium]